MGQALAAGPSSPGECVQLLAGVAPVTGGHMGSSAETQRSQTANLGLPTPSPPQRTKTLRGQPRESAGRTVNRLPACCHLPCAPRGTPAPCTTGGGAPLCRALATFCPTSASCVPPSPSLRFLLLASPLCSWGGLDSRHPASGVGPSCDKLPKLTSAINVPEDGCKEEPSKLRPHFTDEGTEAQHTPC